MVNPRFVALLFFLLFLSQVQAGPTIIQDQRVSNIGATPILGRGYSISTNSYQSNCFAEIKQSEPSYDFIYQFVTKENFLDDDSERKGLNQTLKQFATHAFRKKIFSNPQHKQVNKQTLKIIVSIQLNSYYASLDESQVSISNSATRLIQNNDLPGFFSSCGSYYIKSMIRKAIFFAEFQFESIDDTSDAAFIYLLNTKIKGFNPASTNKNNPPGIINIQQKIKFSTIAKTRKLRIFAAAFGLGKRKNSSLISYDIESFKTAVKNAFITMQNPNTGKVTAIEIIPWIENTNFQSLLAADNQINSTQYDKKYNISLNAGLLAEIERVDRAMMNTYYKAKMCRQFIDSNWKHSRGNRFLLKPNYIKRYVMNNYDSSIGLLLKQLDKYLSKSSIEQLYLKHQSFVYGGKDKKQGVRRCISALQKAGLEYISFRDLDVCNQLEDKLINFNNPIIDNYCMPVLFESKLKPEIVSIMSSD